MSQGRQEPRAHLAAVVRESCRFRPSQGPGTSAGTVRAGPENMTYLGRPAGSSPVFAVKRHPEQAWFPQGCGRPRALATAPARLSTSSFSKIDLQVSLDGVFGDHHPVRDALVRQALHEKAHHLPLAAGQCGQRIPSAGWLRIWRTTSLNSARRKDSFRRQVHAPNSFSAATAISTVANPVSRSAAQRGRSPAARPGPAAPPGCPRRRPAATGRRPPAGEATRRYARTRAANRPPHPRSAPCPPGSPPGCPASPGLSSTTSARMSCLFRSRQPQTKRRPALPSLSTMIVPPNRVMSVFTHHSPKPMRWPLPRSAAARKVEVEDPSPAGLRGMPGPSSATTTSTACPVRRPRHADRPGSDRITAGSALQALHLRCRAGSAG